jgi:uncharacterized protein (DUF983 family)
MAVSRPPLTPLHPATVAQVLGRALRLACPRCGRTRLFAGWFRMHDGCAVCGLRYEREPGYFVGAIYVNYAFTVGVAIGAVLVADATIGLGLVAQLALAVTLCALLPLLFFRHARSLWLGLEYLVTSFDERRV